MDQKRIGKADGRELMKRRTIIAAMLLIGGGILIQFFRPEKNLGERDHDGDMLQVLQVNDTLATLLRNACYDCHSNHTNYPWYNQIAPVSWMMDKHIRKGKEEMNFSEFGNLSKGGRIGVLADICDVVDAGTMPLQSYMLIHKNARLSLDEMESICNWTEKEALRIMSK